MPRTVPPPLDLSTIDDRLIDGLEFCGLVYDLFEQIRSGPKGVERLRLRPTTIEKKLIEELIPIARYVQARYREGRRIKVRWLSGSQPYDAVLWSSGGYVQHRMAPRKLLVEVTMSVHPNDHLARRLLHERGGSFGVKGISHDKRTRAITSMPYVHHNDEPAADLAGQIIGRITEKAAKNYPPGTALIISCIANGLLFESEWNDALARVEKAQQHHAFREVFVFESVGLLSTTLHGRQKRRRQRRSPRSPVRK
jgi:hypothetical protein